jgi:hypothetical protein
LWLTVSCCCCSVVRGFSIPTPFRIENIFGTGGGRPANTPSKIAVDDGSDNNNQWEVTPCAPEESRLVVVAVTDVYTLGAWPFLFLLFWQA